MKAWLITWEWAGPHAAVADKVAAVLSPLWGHGRVAQIVELLYARAHYDVEEMARMYAKVGGSNPYPATTTKTGWIVCGHNPHLAARKVNNLKVECPDEEEPETITWTESTGHEIEPGRVVVEEKACSYTRDRRGPVSDERIWDRAMSQSGPGRED